ncbi:MAG TPA: hypothetical protein DCY79_06625 [Planctomycetaceae bacterium]|nr:hypothetical protein [Blastopirellula sp.]HAY79467.1 hypothetical protein [Planctomycetaceae bacterium]
MGNKWHLSRRTMLQGLGTAIALPLLEVMDQPGLRAAVTTPRPRLAYLYIPNGVAAGAWQPEEVGSDGKLQQLNRWMEPLNPFRDQLTVFRNLWTPRGNGHAAGTATWLTGGGFDHEKLDAGGASVDQIAARHLRSQTLLPSLELSVRGEGMFSSSLPRNAVSWVDSKTPAPRDVEPRAVFDRMFRAGNSGLGSRSVLDLVLEDTRRLKRRVSDRDQKKVDEYLDSVRAIERRIEFAERNKSRADQNALLQRSLRRPEAGVPQDHGAYLRTLMDMIVMAFWADATRVCTCMMDHGQSNRYFNFIDGVTGTWHALSHWKDISGKTEDDDGKTSWSSREQKRGMYNLVTKWHTQQVAYLLDRLSRIEEQGNSLLDRSMIVYGSSLADGHEHSERDLPMLLAGGRAANIVQGRHRGGERATSMSDLHLALLQRLGVPVEQFGESRRPLPLT